VLWDGVIRMRWDKILFCGLVWSGVVWDITGYLMHLHVATILSYISIHRHFEY
jgi:hypothetical protein